MTDPSSLVFADTVLSGRRILVTGASSGIGAHAASLFSKLGAHVILVGRDFHTLSSVFGKLSHKPSLIRVVDLCNPDQIYEDIRSLPPEWLPLHGIFHASGTELVRPVQLIKAKDFDAHMGPSAKSALSIGRAVASKGVMAHGGSVIFMSSVAACTGNTGLSLYSATKGAIEALTRSLAIELSPKLIRINSITAGAVETPMHQRLISGMSTHTLEEYQAKHPLGFGFPSDISNLAVYLLSDASRWVTGSSLVIDGGYSAL